MPKKRISETDMIVSGSAIAPRRKTTPKPRVNRVTKPAEVPTVEVALSETVSRPSMTPHPSQEEIARLAFLFWEARGCQGGSPEEDWLRAEEQLSQRASAATA